MILFFNILSIILSVFNVIADAIEIILKFVVSNPIVAFIIISLILAILFNH